MTHHHHRGREDCWTESETETLIESWGDRYLQLNRGNLRQKDWKDVADAVNATRDLLKIPRTDVQCKNRVDTLKKKYKVEKSKTTPSNWRFFTRLGELIGVGNNITRKKVNGSKSAAVIVAELEDESGGRMERLDDSDGVMVYKELARAIARFGEVYERMESVKQEEMMKMEKERMEFTRELEFQRLNMFVETRVEVEKMKMKKKETKEKRSSGAGSLSPGKKPQR
ncbi:hypothetical protein M8C21_017738 [Ambrosia artemisiifolia]|uniref:Myb/SANT-like DNA-binding domain-containing protein n=1 Tax=Ambrosia artemisiifolia TaxID=4212 RepID=A0AAD5G2S2_AMBAR|nr:hypothetical protein M8C21_017738 [Ambrosia artemisiifolia]